MYIVENTESHMDYIYYIEEVHILCKDIVCRYIINMFVCMYIRYIAHFMNINERNTQDTRSKKKKK